jgi:acetoin utilization protein AcuB
MIGQSAGALATPLWATPGAGAHLARRLDMSTTKLPVSTFMTLVPHPVQVLETLSVARDSMRSLDVHHLPVLSDLDLVGVLSDHDLALANALGVDLANVSVGVAMTAGPYVVEPDASLCDVARTMATKRVGSAIVMSDKKLLGILTTADALVCLAAIADGTSEPGARNVVPSRVRHRIQAEHAELEKLLDGVRSSADRALGADDAAGISAAEVELRSRAQQLYRTLLRHIDLEDAVLAPALTRAPTYGVHRATDLVEKHQSQRTQLQMALALTASSDLEHLAHAMRSLVNFVREDMRAEEAELLTAQALDDEIVSSDFVDG